MKPPDEPISTDEWLVRRVHVNTFLKPLGTGLQDGAFVPRGEGSQRPDRTGISLYRLDCLVTPSDALASIVDEEKRRKTGLVRVSVSDIYRQSLSVKIEHDDNEDEALRIPGHVVIPELSFTCYADKTKKARLKVVIHELTKIGGDNANVLVWPDEA
jgi:hypothetical protein